MDLDSGEYSLKSLSTLNVIVGKNGCGKSTLLKHFESNPGIDAQTKYVTPERGGALSYNAGVEQNMVNDVNWMKSQRRKNQDTQFRQQTVAQYRRLELGVLREMEGKAIADFTPYIEKINKLLDNIEMRREDPTFNLYSRDTGTKISPENLSSGESELISLAIEILVFGNEVADDKPNILFLDSPDVHLHPDLQQRFCDFLIDVVKTNDFRVVAATHSTAFLAGLATHDETSVGFMRSGDKSIAFSSISTEYRTILPVFGAHPLSNVFNEHPILLLEGDDDVRIWQQAVRSSQGKIKLYPVACGSKQEIAKYESLVTDIVQALYDDGRALSLRDGDGASQPLDDKPPLKRFRLNCKSAENLLLTDEVLSANRVTWQEFKKRVEAWLASNDGHPQFQRVKAFQDGGYDRRHGDLKTIRSLIAAQFLGSSKPWEVLVGQSIAGLTTSAGEDTLHNYLGKELCTEALGV